MTKHYHYTCISLIILCALFSTSMCAQQKTAGSSFQHLIGTVHTDSIKAKNLPGYTFREGSLLGVNTAQEFTLDVYQKGNHYVLLFCSLIRPEEQKMTLKVLDVLEIKKVSAGYIIKTAICSVNQQEDEEIIALVKVENTDYMKKVSKAWRCNRSTQRFTTIPTKGIACMNEGFGE